MRRRLRPWLVVYAKGVCMGAADAVPGVSGGTIALIVGIYERLIGAVTAITPGRVRRVLAAVRPANRADARDAVREMDGAFLLSLGSGIVTAVVVVTRALDVAIDAAPVLTFGAFFGLIAASAVVLRHEVSLDTPGRVGAAVAGFTLAFVASGRVAAALDSGLLVTALVGAVAISAMVLPGISGSLILVVLGQYEFLVGRLRAFVDAAAALATGGSVRALLDPGTTVVAFVCGAVVGLFTVTHAVRWALSTYRRATLTFLVCLIVGALRAPVVKTGEKLAAAGRVWTVETIVAFALAALVGGALVALVERYTDGIDY
ncbi:MAG: DUF368 domain-containing protein [Haloplanus sp.]